ncbi:MAG: hypothetical protein ACTS73_06145 [Arsenophonus sp. NEOnobi-MAG3]
MTDGIDSSNRQDDCLFLLVIIGITDHGRNELVASCWLRYLSKVRSEN